MPVFRFQPWLSLLVLVWLADAVLVPAEQAFLQDLYNSVIDRPASWQLNTLITNPCPPWAGKRVKFEAKLSITLRSLRRN